MGVKEKHSFRPLYIVLYFIDIQHTLYYVVFKVDLQAIRLRYTITNNVYLPGFGTHNGGDFYRFPVQGVETIKKIIVAVIILVFIPISYVGAEDKKTVVPHEDKTSKPLKGYLPLPAKHAYYFKEGMTKETETTDFLNCMEGQRRTISFGRVDAVNKETKNDRGYNSTVWITIQCMKNKKFSETKHKIFEYPYPDEDHTPNDH